MKELNQTFVLFNPKDIVSGDFYWLYAKDNKILFAAVDCTGHGVSGALMAMTAISAMNQAIDQQDKGQIDVVTTLTILNRILKQTLRFKDIDAGLDLAFCKINHSNKQIEFGSAGLPLFEYKDGTVREYRLDSQSIGYRASMLDYPYKTTKIEADGSSFFLTTDGLLDEPGGQKGFSFGTDRFKSMIKYFGNQPMKGQIVSYQKEIDTYRGQYKQRDDQTMIGFRL
ncbi:MAG: SpoIIE family protein phosphatase [Leptonema sp. (in: Bacteria)]|nr:SpoIIE family protein phosphatase [Leptonema sp. (in: bacteria)]